MSAKKKIEEEISNIVEEIQDHKTKIIEKEKELEIWKRALKMLPKEDRIVRPRYKTALREGSDMAAAKAAILAAKAPMHINQIMQALGKEETKKNKISLGSSIQAYARQGRVFTRHAPNTFGLIEMEDGSDLV